MYDKSKKTWSQRLKITKSEKTNSAPAAPTEQQQALLRYQQQQHKQQHLLVKPGNNASFINKNICEVSPKPTATATSKSPITPQTLNTYKHISSGGLEGGGGVGIGTYDFTPSALSRSMKYAEPWIYGTVRGLPNSIQPYYYQTSTAALQHGYMVANPAAVFAHPFATSELAIVICSCPEYLSGTKRDPKKASVCKKCKGSRLPLTPIGGTVRLHPSTTPLMLKARYSGSATMRITTSSGSKLRPTILDPQKDPYDLMRRSRLLSPEPSSPAPSLKSSEAVTARNRGKSSSPTRGRSRTRTNLPQPTSRAKKSDTKEATGSSSASVSSASSFKDCWLVEEPELLCAPLAGKSSSSESTRRSILRCNVNPYDLISSKSVPSSASSSSTPSTPTSINPPLSAIHKIRSQNEFMAPSGDDFDVADANLYDTGPSFSPYNKRVPAGTINHGAGSTGGVTERPATEDSALNNGRSNHEDKTHVVCDIGDEDVGGGGGGVDSNAAPNNKTKSYTNIQAIAGQRISLGETGRITKKSLIKQSEDGRIYESIIIAGDDEQSVDKCEQRHSSDAIRVSKQPSTNTELADFETVEQPKRPPRNVRRSDLQEEPGKATTTDKNETKQQINVAAAPTLQPTHGIQLLSVPPSPPIKSILKRPTCLALSDNESAVNQATATPETAAATVEGSSKNSGPRHSRRQPPPNFKREPGESSLSSSSPASATAPTSASASATTTATTPTATFYIPLPQARKKVQFMMEDRIIRVDEQVGNDNDNCSHSSSNNNSNSNSSGNNANVVTDEEEVEFDEAPSTTTSTVATPKSLNYEYYERKRKQQKLMLDKQQQQQQQRNRTATVANLCVQQTSKSDENSAAAATIDAATNNSATSAALEPLNNFDDVSTTAKAIAKNTTTSQQEHQQKTTTLMALLENESNLVSSAVVAERLNNAIRMKSNSNNSNSNSKSESTDVQQQQYIAAVKTPNSNSRSSELSYRDIPAALKEENERLALCIADAPPSAPPTALPNDATPNAVTDDAEEMLWLLLVPSQNDECEQPDQPEQQEQTKPKPQQQLLSQPMPLLPPQLRAFVAPKDDDEMPPLSRNPIRRSHSVRHPSTASNVANSNKNSTIFKFKDTMALRMRNVRLDARDLFASTSSTSQRPKEPPPPPPPAPEAATNTTQLITATALNPTTSKKTTQVCTNAPTSSRRSSLSSLSFGNVATTLSPAGHAQQQQQHDQQHQQHEQQTAINADADNDKHATAARNTEFLRNGLGNYNERQQQEEPPHQRQQSATVHQVVVVAASTGVAADRGSRTTATKNEYERNSNSGNSNDNSNNSTSCQEFPRGTSSSDNYDIDESTLATSKSNRDCQTNVASNATKTSGSTTPPTAAPYNNHNNNSTLFAKKTTATNQQRTVVRVAPFNKVNSEVHRLKISHSDEDSASFINYHKGDSNDCSFNFNYNSDYFWRHTTSSPVYGVPEMEQSPLTAQKKTSILINGDDCYSTMNISHDASTPLYHSSVVVADYSSTSAEPTSPTQFEGLRVSSTTNTVTINVCSSPKRSTEEELIYQHNQINSFLSKQAGSANARNCIGAAIIPINGSINSKTENGGLQRSASSTSSASATSSSSCTSSGSNSTKTKRCRTLIKLDYDKELQQTSKGQQQCAESLPAVNLKLQSTTTTTTSADSAVPPVVSQHEGLLSHEVELVKILRNPVEAVRRNLVPHVCGRNEHSLGEGERSKKMSHSVPIDEPSPEPSTLAVREAPTSNLLLSTKISERNSFIAKLLEDPTLNQVAEGLENETIVQLIENSLKRLKESRSSIDTSGTKDNDDMMRLINMSLQKLREERLETTTTSSASTTSALTPLSPKEEDGHSNRGSISSATSFSSANNYEMFEFDTKSESDCYQSCSSEITSPGDEDSGSSEAAATRSKFYQMLVDATLAEIEISTGLEDEDMEHHYESIRNNADPIYEEITDMPPPLPLSAPPLNDAELDKKAARSMFEGASKYDILSYLVDAKERGLVREEPAFEYPLNFSNPIIIEEEAIDTLSDLGKRKQKIDGRDNSLSRASVMSDSSEDNQSTMSSLSPPPAHSFLGGGGSGLLHHKGSAADIERNDSGVGSETSKTSRSKYQHPLSATATNMLLHKNSPIHLCEDCDGPVEMQLTESGVMFAPLVCRKCGKKRAERKEIITEIVETEEKYGRDLQIVLEEFCQPMLVAGLLTQEQLSAIFLNTEELLENNQTLAERMRDALDIALEQGDDDLLTVNIGRIFLDFTQMLHAFESYCVRQAGASLLLANLEKEKELLRIFLKVSQMENTVLRRMNLNSFLMVPVQRVTKYPLLLARLYKVTPAHLEGRDLLKQAQEKIELHLNHINQEAKDVPTKLWRRISSSSPNRRASCEIDMINIKLRKMAIDVLEWNHDEVRFAMEGKLLYTQPTDSNWKKARTIKLTPVNALLVTNGKPSGNYKAEKAMSDKLNFPKHTGVREASLLVVKEKCGRYTLLREPLYLDRCVVCSEADWDDYFEVQEISSKDTFIFKAEDGVRTKQWYTQLQYHAQGMGAWRKRRNALANIMINGMLARS